MNLYNYLSTVNRLWGNEDGVGVARFVTMRGNHASNPNLHVETPENAVERAIASPLAEVIIYHLKVLFHLHDDRKIDQFSCLDAGFTESYNFSSRLR
jgi:hypothetical protein